MQTIRLATQQDAAAMPDIERSSGEAFRIIPNLAWIADDSVTSQERHEALIRLGAAWVSRDASNTLTGFLTAEVREDVLHIWQMSVRSDQQRKGIGRNLIQTAENWARSKQLVALSLTTFRDVPWNAPFYASCGFQDVDPHFYSVLQSTLEAERQAGLPIEQRCAMIRLL
jgi:GNAT superfamily N-acetyltransferase